MIIRCRYTEMLSVEKLKTLRYPKNPNKHSKEQVTQLASIMRYQGVRHPIIVASSPQVVMTKGHGRLLAAIENGWTDFPVEYQEYDSEEMLYADVVADNAIAMQAELDLSAINLEVPDLGPDFDIDLLGIKDFVIEPADKYTDQSSGQLSEAFMIPPFSVLNAREGWWQDRKMFWISLGIKSEIGRGGGNK